MCDGKIQRPRRWGRQQPLGRHSSKLSPYPDVPERAAGLGGSRGPCFLTQHSGRKDAIMRGLTVGTLNCVAPDLAF